MGYNCTECGTDLKKHDNCGDWFGYTQDVGYICPGCGIQFEKPEYGSFKRRDKKHVSLTGSEMLKMRHYDNFEIQVPWDSEGSVEFEGEVFEKTKEKNDKGHFKYELIHSPFNQRQELTDKEVCYIRKRVNWETPPDFFEWEAKHSNVEYKHSSVQDLIWNGTVSVVDLKLTNHRYGFGE